MNTDKGHYCGYCFLSEDIDDIYAHEKTTREIQFYSDLIQSHFPEKRVLRLVEFGSGTGRLIIGIQKYLMGQNYEIEAFGIETCPVMFRIAKTRSSNITWVNLDTSNMVTKHKSRNVNEHKDIIPPELDSFDAVLLTQGVLLHRPDGEVDPPFEDPNHYSKKILQLSRSILRPNGVIIIDTVRYEDGRAKRKGVSERHGALRLRLYKEQNDSIYGESEFLGNRERVKYWRIESNNPMRSWVSPWVYRCTPCPEEVLKWVGSEGLKVISQFKGYGANDEGRLIIVAIITKN